MNIILASQSPRRRELLKSLGYEFETFSLDIDETYPDTLPIDEVALYISAQKANAWHVNSADDLLITADTVVVLEGKVLGKPASEANAEAMILNLSGKTHQVYTGVTIRTVEEIISFQDVAQITFGEITADEAHFYVRNYKPLDKAGAYGVQEWLGMTKIQRIEGSFYTVMGLPTHMLYTHLKRLVRS